MKWLARALYTDASAENISARLSRTNITPSESDVTGTYTVANFTGYANVTLTSSQSGGTWAAPTTSTGTTSSTYGTNAVFTSADAVSQTVYALYYVFATSGTIAAAESFGVGKAMVSGDSLTLVPKIALD